MTRILFLGAFHNDPSGKNRLNRAITNLTTRYKAAPGFLAFEWAQSTYTALAPRRSEVEKRLTSEFPELGKLFKERFASTLAYEGDIHKEVVPEPTSIWMLDGNYPGDINVPGSASPKAFIDSKIADLDWLLDRIPNWKNLGEDALLEEATSIYLSESTRLARLTDPELMRKELCFPQKLDRESHMFERLRNALTQLKQDNLFGVVVIGVAHLLDVPGSLLNRCHNDGFAIERIWAHEQQNFPGC